MNEEGTAQRRATAYSFPSMSFKETHPPVTSRMARESTCKWTEMDITVPHNTEVQLLN